MCKLQDFQRPPHKSHQVQEFWSYSQPTQRIVETGHAQVKPPTHRISHGMLQVLHWSHGMDDAIYRRFHMRLVLPQNHLRHSQFADEGSKVNPTDTENWKY